MDNMIFVSINYYTLLKYPWKRLVPFELALIDFQKITFQLGYSIIEWLPKLISFFAKHFIKFDTIMFHDFNNVIEFFRRNEEYIKSIFDRQSLANAPPLFAC